MYTFNILPARVYPFEQTFVGTLSVHLRYGVRFLTEYSPKNRNEFKVAPFYKIDDLRDFIQMSVFNPKPKFSFNTVQTFLTFILFKI